VGSCPVRAIREVKEDGSDVFIGDIGVTRCAHGELMGLSGIDWEKKAMLEGKNNDLPVGDPSIIWSFGGESTFKNQILQAHHIRLPRPFSSRSGHHDRCCWHGAARVGCPADGRTPHVGLHFYRQRGQREGVLEERFQIDWHI